MKICSKCNRENEDSARFCDFCGTPMEEQTAYQAPTPQTVTPVFEKTPPAFETGTEKPKKKLNKKVLLLLIGLLSVGGITVLIGALTNWFGLGSPLNGLFKAFAKTAEAESLTINVKMKVGDEKGDASARYVLDPEKESVSLLAEIDAGNRSQKFALYKGDAIQVSTSKDMDFDSYSYADINEDVLDEEEFFEQLEEFKENAEDPDWDELVENAGLSDYVDSDEIQAFLEEFFKEKLSDSDWLETYLGFEKDGSTYSFEPELRDLADEMGDILIDSDVLSAMPERQSRNSLRIWRISTIWTRSRSELPLR